MDLHLKLGLLLALTTSTIADVPFYVPQITFKPFQGKLTYSTFTLDEPQCIFQQYNTSTVWLVVALNSAVPNLTEANLSTLANYSSFKKNGYHHIYPKTASKYPCADMAPQPIAVLPVGIESNCTNVNFCNGPLPNPGPYRAKFVVLNNNNTMVNSTRWSEVINLRTVMPPPNLVPQGRSAGMIVIVVILSVLTAILLACLIAALVMGSKDICWCHTLDSEGFLVMEEVDMEEYVLNTTYFPHNMYKTHSRRLTKKPSTVYTVFK
ncbi:PREDICTED: uroplakin-3b-like [Nanorana parkeri]|uniref:uroplakin-3b-like n=1 Tax=Nanorana parkeri TaxID=125878 RepID=UPI0008544BB6|nr:PREDICTED: uroplakin-3b-like [Nanorana parkeri]